MRDLSCGDARVFLEFEVRRVFCHGCGAVKQEALPWLAGNPFSTKRLSYDISPEHAIPEPPGGPGRRRTPRAGRNDSPASPMRSEGSWSLHKSSRAQEAVAFPSQSGFRWRVTRGG